MQVVDSLCKGRVSWIFGLRGGLNPLLSARPSLDRPVKRSLKLPLYYTGLSDTAMIRREEGQPLSYKLDRQYNVEVPIEMAPRSVTWFVIE